MSTVQINLSFQQLADVVRQLSPADKIKLNEVIWDNATIPATHQKLVLDRVNQANTNPENLMDWDEAVKTL